MDLRSRNQARLLWLSFLAAAVSFLAAGPARSDVIPTFGALGVDIPRDSKPPESMPVWVDCYCVTHGTIEPCAKAVALSMRDEECEGSAGHPCGHQQDRHSPRSPLDADSWWEKAGFLTDTRDPEAKLKATFGGVLPEDPLVLNLKYTAGQVSGRFEVTAVFSSPPPRHYFLTPEDSPPGDCDSHGSCTEALVVSVSYPGLEELPPPILTATDQVTGRTVQVPWVRCGKTGTGGTSPCTAEADNAYNWPAHPTVHWGLRAMKQALRDLGWTWFERCSQRAVPPANDGPRRPASIVITDMSLPGGGVLDIGVGWQPTNPGEWLSTRKGGLGKGHHYHRDGTDADISALSVPEWGTCGARPSGSMLEERIREWGQTALHEPGVLAPAGLFLPYANDPNHVRLTKGASTP